MSLFVSNLNDEVNDSELFNQIYQVVSVCRNLATQHSLSKDLDPKQSSLMDSKKLLHYSNGPFCSTSFCNRSSIALLAAVDDFVYAKSFPNLSVLEEMVKEMEKDTEPPWKIRKEDELLFVVLWNLLSSPEPPWEHLYDGIQPQDHGNSRSLHAPCFPCLMLWARTLGHLV